MGREHLVRVVSKHCSRRTRAREGREPEATPAPARPRRNQIHTASRAVTILTVLCPRVLPAACALVRCPVAAWQPCEPHTSYQCVGKGVGDDGVGMTRQPSSTAYCCLLLLCPAGSSARCLWNAVCEPLLSGCPCRSVSPSCLVAHATALMPDSDRDACAAMPVRLWDLPSGESAR